jgi:hypothetical protein
VKAHEVRALIADPVAKARMHIEEAIVKCVLNEPRPISCYVELSLSSVDAERLKADLYADGFSVSMEEVYVSNYPAYGFAVIWHEKARTVRGPRASNTISDTGPSKPNGDRQ